ncbi:MAG: hypothetical protein M3198_13315 [Actinomycetota bacterium]|nr:hypothetical protein [Actinomycetota bacterium]
MRPSVEDVAAVLVERIRSLQEEGATWTTAVMRMAQENGMDFETMRDVVVLFAPAGGGLPRRGGPSRREGKAR